MHAGGGGGDLKTSRRRLHGSLSSLPSSIMSSRPGRDKRSRVIDDRVRKLGRDGGGRVSDEKCCVEESDMCVCLCLCLVVMVQFYNYKMEPRAWYPIL